MKALFGIALIMSAVSFAAGEKPIQWEYKEIGRQFDRPLDLEQLNQLGAQGWELVTCPLDHYERLQFDPIIVNAETHCYLKRRK